MVKVIFLRKVYNDNCIYGFFLIAPVIYKSTVLSGPKLASPSAIRPILLSPVYGLS